MVVFYQKLHYFTSKSTEIQLHEYNLGVRPLKKYQFSGYPLKDKQFCIWCAISCS